MDSDYNIGFWDYSADKRVEYKTQSMLEVLDLLYRDGWYGWAAVMRSTEVEILLHKDIQVQEWDYSI